MGAAGGRHLPDRGADRAWWARIDFLPYLLVGPAVLVVALVTVYPAVSAIGISTTDANLLRLAASKSVGVDNYTVAWDDEIFTQAVWQTVRWVVVNAAGQMLLALPVAVFLNTTFRGRGLVRAAILVPWVVTLTGEQHRWKPVRNQPRQPIGSAKQAKSSVHTTNTSGAWPRSRLACWPCSWPSRTWVERVPRRRQ